MEGDKDNIETIANNFGLGKGLITNLLKSEAVIKKAFLDTIRFSELEKTEQKIGNMLYSIATKLPLTA
jgi:hypothetical protein